MTDFDEMAEIKSLKYGPGALSILEGVDLKNEQLPMYLVSERFNDLTDALREHEIEHTVKFVTAKLESGFCKEKCKYCCSSQNSAKLVQWGLNN